MIFRLIHADVLDGLRLLADESVQVAVTSPPYWGLRDYGIEPSVWLPADLRGCPEPICPDGHEWGAAGRKGGGSHAHTASSQQNGVGQMAAHEQISSASTGQLCGACGAWRGCLGLEPTPELFVEHIVAVFREVRRVLRDDGTLWLNLGDTYGTGTTAVRQRGTLDFGTGTMDARQVSRPGGDAKQLLGIPWRVALALQADGWYLRSDIIWHKPNPMPESVTDRPTKSHEYLFLLTKSARYFYDADAIREPDSGQQHDRTVLSGAPSLEPSGGLRRPHGNLWGTAEKNGAGRNKRSVWTVATAPFPEAHFATFPPDLIEPCILAGSRIGDTVLDPFNGSGTTGAVALGNQRDYVGIELNGDYVEMARRRLESVCPMFSREVAG